MRDCFKSTSKSETIVVSYTRNFTDNYQLFTYHPLLKQDLIMFDMLPPKLFRVSFHLFLPLSLHLFSRTFLSSILLPFFAHNFCLFVYICKFFTVHFIHSALSFNLYCAIVFCIILIVFNQPGSRTTFVSFIFLYFVFSFSISLRIIVVILWSIILF